MLGRVTARRSYASAVLGVVILFVCPSVRPSVRLSVCHTRALWLIQRTYRQYFIPHKRAILVFYHQQWLVGDVPFHQKWPMEVTHPLQKSLTSTDFCLTNVIFYSYSAGGTTICRQLYCKGPFVEMKISIQRKKLRFVLYIELTCTWFKICILICCVCVIVRF